MTGPQSLQFVEYLRRGRQEADPKKEVTSDDSAQQRSAPGAPHAKLWETTNLSPAEFADEAAHFFGHSRVSLQEILAATPLVSAFSQRFLRETLVFPYEVADRGIHLAVADPTDLAPRRAAEIVLGPDIKITIASSEDLAAALDQRLADPTAQAETGGLPVLREDDVDSLHDLASGAPVVRAVNDLLEKAVELRASDIHIEPFQSGLVVRLRIDGVLRPITAPAGVVPQAMISRIKIIASLNITSPNAACRRTALHGCAPAAPTSIFGSPSCRPNTENPSSSASCRRIADF